MTLLAVRSDDRLCVYAEFGRGAERTTADSTTCHTTYLEAACVLFAQHLAPLRREGVPFAFGRALQSIDSANNAGGFILASQQLGGIVRCERLLIRHGHGEALCGASLFL